MLARGWRPTSCAWWSPLVLRAHDQHGTRRVTHASLGNAEKRAPHAVVAIAAFDHDVGGRFLAVLAIVTVGGQPAQMRGRRQNGLGKARSIARFKLKHE